MSKYYIMAKIQDLAHSAEKSQGWCSIEQKREVINALQELIGTIESSIVADQTADSATNENNGPQTWNCVPLVEAEQHQKMAEAIGKITFGSN